MTPLKQRIAIAEACGWTDCYYDASRCAVAPTGMFTRYAGTPSEVTIRVGLLDYLSDLNAMHEAEKVLMHKQQIDFMEWLGMCCDDYGHKVWKYVHATAAQRAEAFLKTIGKWEESQ